MQILSMLWVTSPERTSLLNLFEGVPGGSSTEQVACMAQALRESGACVLSDHII